VSIGVISSIITKERERIPDINALRELKVALIHADTNPVDALRGAGFLDIVSPEDNRTCVRLYPLPIFNL
jgi:hypothetical protein